MTTNVNSNMSGVQLIATKAGMEHVDMEKVNEIVLKASKGSNFYIRQQQQQAQINKKIEEMKLRLSQLTELEKINSKDKMDKLVARLEEKRDTSHVIVHIDMDAFYAAVEMRDCPPLADVPMAVGGLSMLSTSNYHARKFGVRAAMPGFIAKKLCPELTIVKANYAKYTQVSNEVRAILAQYDSNYCSMSLDEAYLDITPHVEERQLKDCDKMREEIAEEIVAEIRQKIFQSTKLTCSAGISVNTRLAKVCSDMNKPNGQFCTGFRYGKIKEFVEKLPIRKVSGIGKVTEQQLNALDVMTCGDLWEHRAIVGLLFSEISSETFLKISLGLGSINLSCDDPRKSMSVERTFKDIWKIEDLKKKCHELCNHLSEDLKKEIVVGKTVGLKIKTVSFHIKTRAKTLTHHTSDPKKIYNAALWLLEQEIKAVAPKPLKLRLMGIRMSALLGEHEISSKQLTLDDIMNNSNQNKLYKETGETYQCPICRKEKLEEKKINKHVAKCMKKFEMDNSLQMKAKDMAETSVSETSVIISSESTDGSPSSHIDNSDIIIQIMCPVCNKQHANQYPDNEAFNRHIDECLSKKKVSEIIKEMKTECHDHGEAQKRPLLTRNQRGNKRNKPTTSHNFTTIDMFFKP